MSRTCIEPGCTTYPCFNYSTESKGIYCFKHKDNDMVNVFNKKCIEPGCTITPSYGYKGDKKITLYCSKHKKDDMYNLKCYICIFDGCITIASQNKAGESKPLYCKLHKDSTMIDVHSKKCIESGCNTNASYNIKDNTIPLYCDIHKKDNMYNIKGYFCIEKDCSIRAHYNREGEKNALYCKKHSSIDMINILSKTCRHTDCNVIPNYNYEGKKGGLYCFDHKLDGMIDVKHNICKTPLCYTRVTKKYEGYCLSCFVHLFPDKPNTKNYKTKEKDVSDFITEKYKDKTIITDRKIVDGCSKRRPDMLLDLGEQVIIIEVDENQHIDYDCSCENKRIMELSKDIDHRPLVFIRFNPDEYKDSTGKNITSCWGTNTSGISSVKKTKRAEWRYRLNALKESVDYWITNRTNKTVEIVQLFYNQDLT